MLRAVACLTAVSLAVALRAAAGPVLPGIGTAASALSTGPSRAGQGPASGARASGADPATEPFPDDPDVFRGLGFADKRAHPLDYRDRARTAALAQIARAISVTIHSEIRSSRREGPAGFSEAWSDSIRAQGAAELSGYRLERSRETADGYWALYALDRDVYARDRARATAAISARMEAQAFLIEADLDGRRLQAACVRAAGMRDSLARHPDLAPPQAYLRAAARLEAAASGSRLAAGGTWAFSVDPGWLPAQPPYLRLTDAQGLAWQGPLRVVIRNLSVTQGVACEAWTGFEGSLDLSRPFLACGVGEGHWRVEWIGPGSAPAAWEGKVVWVPQPVGLGVFGGPSAAGWATAAGSLERLREGLAARCGPRYRAAGEGPALELRLTAADQDSLEGMRFASVHGEIRLPGAAAPIRLLGKGGHADAARARERALEDLLEAAGRSMRGE